MKLSVIIVNYNSGKLTGACIKSLLAQPLPPSSEILVVDNASSDDSVAFLRSDFPEIKVIANQKNVGFGAGVNQGIRQAEGKYYLVLNPDIVALSQAINNLITFMEENPEVGVAGGQLVYPNGKLQPSCFRFYSPLTILARRSILGKTRLGRRENNRFLMSEFDHKSVKSVEWLMGSCLMLRKKAVDEVGLMDERFFMYFEDVDWCRRFWESGWKVMYVPTARFSHFHQQASKKHAWLGILTNWTTREHIRSAVKYFWKYRGNSQPKVG